jgi:hypothetical protein
LEVLEDLRSSLEEFYEEVDIREQRRSIRVRVEGEVVDDEVLLDVVPAISPDGIEQTLWVPDRDRKKWIKSNTGSLSDIRHSSSSAATCSFSL